RRERGAAMCVLLCAGSKVHEWLDMPLALAHRQSLQACPICAAKPALMASQQSSESKPALVEAVEMDEAARRHVMKRSSWLQAYCRCRGHLTKHGIHCAESGQLSLDWPKAFEAIAKTWGRLLSLVGLRW